MGASPVHGPTSVVAVLAFLVGPRTSTESLVRTERRGSGGTRASRVRCLHCVPQPPTLGRQDCSSLSFPLNKCAAVYRPLANRGASEVISKRALRRFWNSLPLPGAQSLACRHDGEFTSTHTLRLPRAAPRRGGWTAHTLSAVSEPPSSRPLGDIGHRHALYLCRSGGAWQCSENS